MDGSKEVKEKRDQLVKAKKEQDILLEKYSDGPYDLNCITNEIKFLLVETARNIVEIGKRLIIVREREGRGNWQKWIEDNFPFSRRTAYLWIAVARKLADSNVQTFAHLNISKVYALMEVPEEELKELEETGSIAGMTLDEIDRMSTRELKDKVRRYKDQLEEGKKQYEKLEEENQRLREGDESIPENLKPNELEIEIWKIIDSAKRLFKKAEEAPIEERQEAGKMLEEFSYWTSKIAGIINPTGMRWEPVKPDLYEEQLKDKYRERNEETEA